MQVQGGGRGRVGVAGIWPTFLPYGMALCRPWFDKIFTQPRMEVGVRVEYNGRNGIIDKISKNEDTNKPAYTIRYDDGETQCVEFDGCDKLKVISEGESLFMSWVKAATAETK